MNLSLNDKGFQKWVVKISLPSPYLGTEISGLILKWELLDAQYF